MLVRERKRNGENVGHCLKVKWDKRRIGTEPMPIWDHINSKMPTKILKGMTVYSKINKQVVRIHVEEVQPDGSCVGVVISEQTSSSLKRGMLVNISSEYIHSFSER